MVNMTQLNVLDLRDNFLFGKIPLTIRNLSSLLILDLSHNQFSGEVPIFLENKSDLLLNSLKYLRLESNMFSGLLPENLGEFRNRKHLLLADNLFCGPIPTSIGQLSKLERLDLSSTSLDGKVSELHFVNLTRLNELSLSSNQLVLDVSPHWVPPFQLQTLDLGNCKLGPQFPPWLQTQRHVDKLVMSNTSISDTIPDWFENLYSHINWLDISHNQITGRLPKFQESNGSQRFFFLNSNKFEGILMPIPSGIVILDLSNNLLSGRISVIINNATMRLEIIALSNNNLNGGIPVYLCKIKALKAIIFSKNQLLGKLPSRIGDLHQREVIDLMYNNLHGEIPTSLGSLRNLNSLHLNNKKFEGKIFFSLQNMTYLETLDLSENEFIGILPPWIGENLSNLKFLNLQSKKFYGDLSPQLCHLLALQLLNLAHNDITGNIPRCFGNFSAMNVEEEFVSFCGHIGKVVGEFDISFHISPTDNIDYKDSISLYMKGRKLEYTKTLPFVISIDLSNNHITGEIPGGLMDLVGLQNLNISGNYLNGRIPKRIGNLKNLESLDLSRNKLSGSIPQSLLALNFLSFLNLSSNNLSGIIPTGSQLQMLNDPSSIYGGNSELCGPQISKPCSGDTSSDTLSDGHEHVGETEDGDESELLWFYGSIGPGFLVGFLGVCGILHFKKSWRYAYFQFVENTYNNAVAVKVAWVQRKFRKDKIAG
ncbi:receptor-like protein EIX2 [Cornus florida]|uniref:receptor-like protein EIX2 n=1 Tax=Cornus florida TaxID=4283 RepID=UPI00289CBEC5|nr:receptor-like protein EIX2 [Cornus florida]